MQDDTKYSYASAATTHQSVGAGGGAQGAAHAFPLRIGGKIESLNNISPNDSRVTVKHDARATSVLDHYAHLLLAEHPRAVMQRAYVHVFSFIRAHNTISPDNYKSFAPLAFSLFSCLPSFSLHRWWPEVYSMPSQGRSFRVAVELLHFSLDEFHLFLEEDTLARELLSAWEAYAYTARSAGVDQLTARLHSCLQLSKEMRKRCGAPQDLRPLLQAAVAVVSVYLQTQPPDQQQVLLLRELHMLPQVLQQLQSVKNRLYNLKLEHPQIWKEWLNHMQQRRLLRVQRDQEWKQLVSAHAVVEGLWELIQQQRKKQKFASTGLELQLMLLSRDEAADKQQLVEEVTAELEESLAYAVDTLNSQQLANLDIFQVISSILSKLSIGPVRRPGVSFSLMLISTKERVRDPHDTLSIEASQDQQERGHADKYLPSREQFRRFLCQRLSAAVSCQINGRPVGCQQNIALQFPFFSTSTIPSVASSLPLEALPVRQGQQLQTESVVASFQATIGEPLSSISLHIGATHPGLSKPVEARVDVPLSQQLEKLAFELLSGSYADPENSSTAISSPVALCLDLPFNSTKGETDATVQQHSHVAQASRRAKYSQSPNDSVLQGNHCTNR
ncbi:hypothetical protein cyc_00255 [Cyclospora cayetanensis]|uniref:Uncharacterized protein n=1 Tax=Cyclospora cayetanensis TaxID=88456 RepID=A0A1D3D9P3_9EIME|nr:hypothetical protein cyc_00255 [Cyclospora cayetanensis]